MPVIALIIGKSTDVLVVIARRGKETQHEIEISSYAISRYDKETTR